MAAKTLSRAMQRQIDLTTAVCQERLLAAHVRHALGVVDLVSDGLPFDDALDIYVRILRLNAEQARNVGSRALAELGRRSDALETRDLSRAYAQEEEDAKREEPEEVQSEGRAGAVLGRLRRRLQGRVHGDLRHRINLAAARTEDDLFSVHVENALLFVKSLADEVSAPDAVELYLETMLLPEGLGDVVYNRALRLIADQVLPSVPQPEKRPIGEEGATREEDRPLLERSSSPHGD